ncbi:hypothetical protein TRVL_06800 [Trypanosoma vivax]|nr:hypothetical protein TRVL_06800 [Trypanosoma vivax]
MTLSLCERRAVPVAAARRPSLTVRKCRCLRTSCSSVVVPGLCSPLCLSRVTFAPCCSMSKAFCTCLTLCIPRPTPPLFSRSRKPGGLRAQRAEPARVWRACRQQGRTRAACR